MQKGNQYQHQLSFCQARSGWRDTPPFMALCKYIFYNNLAKCFLGILAADRVLKEVNELVTVSGQWATSNPWSTANPRSKEHRPCQEAMDGMMWAQCTTDGPSASTILCPTGGMWFLDITLILNRIQILNERLQSIQLSPLKSDNLGYRWWLCSPSHKGGRKQAHLFHRGVS